MMRPFFGSKLETHKVGFFDQIGRIQSIVESGSRNFVSRRFYLFIYVISIFIITIISFAGQADVYYLNGLTSLSQNEKEKALVAFQHAVELDPTLANAHFSIGMLLKEKGVWQPARNALQNAVRADPDYIAAYCALAELQIEIFVQIDQAILLLKKANTIKQKDSQVHKWLGIAYFQKGQFRDALTELLSSVTVDSSDVKAMYMLGLTYTHLENYESAVQKFKMLIDKDPFHKQAHFNLGNVYVRLGLIDQANSILQRFQEIDLEDKTLTLLQQRVDRDSKDVDAWYQLGRIYSKRRKWQEAIAPLSRCIALEHHSRGHEVLGFVYVNMEAYDEAVQHYAIIVQLDPENSTYRNSLGSVYLMLEKYELAIKQLKIASQLEPSDARIQLNLSIAYQQMGNQKLADQAYFRHQKLQLGSTDDR